MALRSIWNGTITFAGVFVPIKVHSATENRSVHFHEVHVDDGARIDRALWSGSLSFGLVNVPVQIVSAVRDVDLRFRQLHEQDKAPIETKRWCSEEDKEVPYEAITRKTRTIDIERFVDLAEVDPIYFDHPYTAVALIERWGGVGSRPAREPPPPAPAEDRARQAQGKDDRDPRGRRFRAGRAPPTSWRCSRKRSPPRRSDSCLVTGG